MRTVHFSAAPALALFLAMGAAGTATAADVDLEIMLRQYDGSVLQLDPANRYFGNIYWDSNRPHLQIEANGAELALGNGMSFNADGSRITITNARVTGVSGAFFLAGNGGAVTLRESTLTGNGSNNAIFASNATVTLSNVTMRNLRYGMNINNVTLVQEGALTMEQVPTGILAERGTLRLDDLEYTGAGTSGGDGIQASNLTLELRGGNIRNVGIGLSLRNVTLRISGGLNIEQVGTGILMVEGGSLDVPFNPGPRPLTISRASGNGILATGIPVRLNAVEITSCAGIPINIVAGVETVLANSCRFVDNSEGLLVSGGTLAVSGAEFQTQAGQNMRLNNVTGTISNSTFLGGIRGLTIAGGDVTVENCLFPNSRQYGIDVFRGEGQTRPRVVIRGCEIVVPESRVDIDWDTGINLNGARDSLIEGNLLRRWRTGIQVAASDVTIRGNDSGFSRQPIRFGDRGQGVAVITQSNVTVEYNYIHDTEGDNIFVAGGSNAVIRRNLLVRSRENGVLVEQIEGTGRTTAAILDNDIRNPTLGVAIVGDSTATVIGNTIRVPFEDRVFVDPSRGVLLQDTTAPSIVENNLIIDAPLTGIYATNSNDHIVRGNMIYNGGRAGVETLNVNRLQLLANIVIDSWENGLELRGGVDHQLRQNLLADNFRRQVTDASSVLYHQVALLAGARALLVDNSLTSTRPRRGGIESNASTAIASFNWWGDPAGPITNPAEAGTGRLLNTGGGITAANPLAAPTVTPRFWKRIAIPANQPTDLQDFAGTGVGLRLTLTEAVDDAVIALARFAANPRSPAGPYGDNTRYIQYFISHETRAALVDDRFSLRLAPEQFSGRASWYDPVNQVWMPIAAAGGKAIGLTIRTDLVPNTVLALEAGSATVAPIQVVLGSEPPSLASDVNDDGVVDAADVARSR